MKVGSKLVREQMADKSNKDVGTCVPVSDPGAIHARRDPMIHVHVSLKRHIKPLNWGDNTKRYLGETWPPQNQFCSVAAFMSDNGRFP